jgi:SAM-dependent methyltransferase
MDASDWDEKYRAAHDHLWSDAPNIFVEDRLRHATSGVGVDLAGGEGRNSIWLASMGWKMTCVDFSAEAIARGRQRSDDVEFVVADVLEWEPDGFVDLVLMAYLHLEEADFWSVVDRARGWLAPGGELFMIGHDAANIEEGYGGPTRAEVLWDLDLIVDRLPGMRVIEAQVVRRPVETDDGYEYALDTLVRVRRPV